MYDPITGKYGLAIITLVRIAGIATVIAMAIGILVMLRRERRTAANSASVTTSYSESTG
jgi:hypothetical protein